MATHGFYDDQQLLNGYNSTKNKYRLFQGDTPTRVRRQNGGKLQQFFLNVCHLSSNYPTSLVWNIWGLLVTNCFRTGMSIV